MQEKTFLPQVRVPSVLEEKHLGARLHLALRAVTPGLIFKQHTCGNKGPALTQAFSFYAGAKGGFRWRRRAYF